MSSEIMFTDFKQAFDSMNRQQLMRIVEEIGIPTKLKSLVKTTPTKTKAKIRTSIGETEKFGINKRLGQGDPHICRKNRKNMQER